MMTRNETHVNQIINNIKYNMIDRFTVHSHPKHLVNISSGLLVKSKVSKSLLIVVNKGQSMLKDFVKTLLSEGALSANY